MIKNETNPSSKMINQVNFASVKITDSFWSPRLKSHVISTLPVCIDQIENKTGRIRNFENAGKGTGEHSGIFTMIPTCIKHWKGWHTALSTTPPIPNWRKKCDEWIDKFAAAQQPDGTSIHSTRLRGSISDGQIWTSTRCTVPDI